MSLRDKITHFYIKNIKRWIFCPSCHADGVQSKMRVDRGKNLWICDKCGYSIFCNKFEDGIIFWFCDGCGAFLNKQGGFTETNKRWACSKCGFNNDVTEANIINECVGCGKRMPSDYKPLYCLECKVERAQKIVDFLELTSEVCFKIANALKNEGSIQKRDYENVENYASMLESSYEEASNKDKKRIDDVVYKTTGKRLSTAFGFELRCANCENTNSSLLFDEGDTVYCSRCCHRTRKSDGQDDLVVCPVCRHLKDRKAMYCQWCNNSDPDAKYDPEEEALVNEFENNITSNNLRYFKLKGRRKL